MTVVRTFPDELSMSRILRPRRWEWLDRVLQRSNLTSSNSERKRLGLTIENCIGSEMSAFPRQDPLCCRRRAGLRRNLSSGPVHTHVVAMDISLPHQPTNMHSTWSQQLAIRAMLRTWSWQRVTLGCSEQSGLPRYPFQEWRQSSNAVTVLTTNALKQSSCRRTRVTHPATSAGLR